MTYINAEELLDTLKGTTQMSKTAWDALEHTAPTLKVDIVGMHFDVTARECYISSSHLESKQREKFDLSCQGYLIQVSSGNVFIFVPKEHITSVDHGEGHSASLLQRHYRNTCATDIYNQWVRSLKAWENHKSMLTEVKREEQKSS